MRGTWRGTLSRVPACTCDDPSQSPCLASQVYLPPSVTGRSPTGDPEVLVFHQQLNALNKKISEGEIDIPPEGERSPSPPPTYDAMGIRLNTREVRY